MSKGVAAKLDSIEWDFADADTRGGAHAMHPYPAKFIPQIPRSLIELFHPGDASAVLDPFCGSGTTLVEAASFGLDAVGIDLNPLATLVAKVKTTRLTGDLPTISSGVITAAQQRLAAGDVRIPAIPNLDHWFKPEIQSILAALVAEIDGHVDPVIRDALKVALSSIIVRVSNQDSDTRYAAIEKTVKAEQVWMLFERAAANVAHCLDGMQSHLFSARSGVRILTADIMEVQPESVGTVGLVITSPPYPNAYEYWLYHKYRMYWLGMDPIAVREREIGARPHYFKRNHQTAADFERQMGRCFWLLSRVMKPDSYACFIVGRSIIHGQEIDNEALLERAATPHAFVKAGSSERAIAVTRKAFNPSHGKINRETILIFKSGGSNK